MYQFKMAPFTKDQSFTETPKEDSGEVSTEKLPDMKTEAVSQESKDPYWKNYNEFLVNLA